MTPPSSLGLLGLGARTTSFYLTYLNKIYTENFNGDGTFPLTLVNTNFDQINRYLPAQFDKLALVLKPYLSQVNCARLIVPNITLHETLDVMRTSNLIHPVYETIRFLQQDNCSKVILLGSQYSMKAPYLSDMLKVNGIDVMKPLEDEQIQLDIWRKRIYAYQETTSDVLAYQGLIRSYSLIAPIVVACTELSLITPQTQSNIYDMTRIQMRAAFKS